MHQLKELIHIISKQKLKGLDSMTHYSRKGKLNDLYEGIHAGQFESDKQAINALYQEESSDEKSIEEAFRKLKKRLMNQLVNTMLFIGASDGFTKSQQAVYDCLKYSTAAKILRYRSGFNVSERLAKRTLKKAIRLEQSNIVLEMADLLRGLMSRNGNEEKFDKYNQLFHQYNPLVQAEYMAKEYIDHIVLLLSRSASMEEVIPLARKYEADLRKLVLEKTSATFLAYSYLVYVDRCEFENDHKALQENCEEIIKILEERASTNRTFIFVFLFKSLDTYRRFQQFEKGKEALHKSLEFVSGTESANWILVKSQYVRLCFFCNKIKEGYAEFQSVMLSNSLRRMPLAEQEPWELYKGYFSWFEAIGRLKTEAASKKIIPFLPAKFVKTVPLLSKDKEGYNASVLVLQLLFLIQMRNHDALIDKTEALKMYNYRYLRKKQMYRTNRFVKLLLLIPSSGFNKRAIIRRGELIYNRMCAKPISQGAISSNVEIVPYEMLWDAVLELLD